MRSVGIKVLKNKLSEYVRAAEGGERVRVTDRGRVVAELVPLPADRVAELNASRAARGGPSLDAFQERGVREGWLLPATRFGPLPSPGYPPLLPEGQLLQDLAKDREDR